MHADSSAASIPRPIARARRIESACLAVLLALAGGFYFWTATTAGNPAGFAVPTHDLYHRLTEGFLAGRTSFLEEPPPELARLANPYDPAQNAPYVKYHDVTYFEGRYYLYFGPTPVVLLLAPWRLLTGVALPQHLALVAFAWGAVALAVLLLRAVRDRWFPTVPAWSLVAGAVALAFGALWPVLLRRPLHYELAIASAAFCGLAALLALLRAEGSRRPGAWLALAGLALGLAVAARPSHVFAAAAVVGAWLYLRWRSAGSPPPAGWRPLAAPALALAAPFAAVIAALLAYNHARFGSPLEFGTSYMLAGSNQQGLGQFSLRYLPINLYYHLLALPHVGAYFPFVLVTGFPPFAPPAGYSGQENMYGLLVTLPFLWTALALWPALRRGAPAWPGQAWCRVAAALVAGIGGFLLLLMGAANRYLLEYVTPLALLAVVGCWRLDGLWSGWRRFLLRAGWLAGVATAVAFTTLVSLQHNELLRHHNPALYARLARAANGLAEPFTGATRASGPLRIELRFPADRTGKLEPLVVTGVSFRADFLYVFYRDDRHIVLGFEHTSYGGPMSPPIEIDYDERHLLEVEMGSLHPPREHPYWDSFGRDETEERKRMLRVRLDGATVLEAQVDFYDASPGHVAVGRNPVSDAFGRRFTGRIDRVTRGGHTY